MMNAAHRILGFVLAASLGTGAAHAQAPQSAPTAPATPAPTPPATGAPTALPTVDARHMQRSPATLSSPTQVSLNNPALLQLARERAALELVDHSAQQAALDSARRIGAMHAFVESNGLSAALAQFTRSYQTSGAQITFRAALDTALAHLASRAIAPPSNDLQHMEQAVQVESAAAHASFDQLNSARRTTEMLASFLAGRRQLGDYQRWAAAHAASVAQQTGALTDPAQRAAATDRRALQLGWDNAQQAQMQQYPPAVEPGQAVAHGPYASTWWNSYADPYYDLSGYPGRDPSLQSGAGPADYGSTGAPADYAWATQGYSRDSVPVYGELGPNVAPAFGTFPGGAAGGRGFGPGAGGK